MSFMNQVTIGKVNQLSKQVSDNTSSLSSIVQVDVKKLGAVGDGITDDTTAIQNAINSLTNGGIVYLLQNHLINGTIALKNNITIKPLTTTTVKATVNMTTMFSLPQNTDNVSIEGITFDYGSLCGGYGVYVYENVTNLKLENLKFKNFHNTDSTTQMNVIKLRTGTTGSINNISFYNITGVGNGVIEDNGGALRCIRTDNYQTQVPPVYNDYNLNISNIHIDTVYNVDSSGNFIIEDCDPIHFQHYTSVNGFINVSNVTARNFSKRLFKIQGSGVNITNVVAETTLATPWLISILGDHTSSTVVSNINISNIVANGNIGKVMEILDSANVNISDIQINSNYAGSTVYDNLFNIYDSSNVNITGVTGSAYGGFLIYGAKTQNITVDKVNLNLSAQILFLQDRTSTNLGGTYSGGIISNINFTRCAFNVPSVTQTVGGSQTYAYGASLFDIEGTGSANPIQQLNFRDIRISTNQTYQYALMRITNANDVFFDNLYIENNSALNNPNLIVVDGNATVQMRKLSIKGTPTSQEILVKSTSYLYLQKSSITNASINGTTPSLEVDETPVSTVNYVNGATGSQLISPSAHTDFSVGQMYEKYAGKITTVNGTANQKADVYFTGTFQGYFDVTVVAGWASGNANGKLTKRFSFNTSTGNTIAYQETAYTETNGALLNQLAISDITYDSTNNRWKIQLVQLSSSVGETYQIFAQAFCVDNASMTTMQTLGVTSVYTTDSTLFPAPIRKLVGVTQFSGARQVPILVKSANYTLTNTDDTILASSFSAAFTITLPDATTMSGRIYTIKKTDSSANAVTIATTNSQTIDGASTKAITTQYTTVRVQSDGSNWWIV